MTTKYSGFTLVEMMIAVSVLAVIMVGGTLVMFKTISSRGQNQADININQIGSQAMDAIEQSVKFSYVDTVGGFSRVDCIGAGSAGVSGNILTVSDQWGTTTYATESFGGVGESVQIASNSTPISSPIVNASSLVFTWICGNNVSDKLSVSFDLDDVSVQGGVLRRTFRRYINMYNSGI